MALTWGPTTLLGSPAPCTCSYLARLEGSYFHLLPGPAVWRATPHPQDLCRADSESLLTAAPTPHLQCHLPVRSHRLPTLKGRLRERAQNAVHQPPGGAQRGCGCESPRVWSGGLRRPQGHRSSLSWGKAVPGSQRGGVAAEQRGPRHVLCLQEKEASAGSRSLVCRVGHWDLVWACMGSSPASGCSLQLLANVHPGRQQVLA